MAKGKAIWDMKIVQGVAKVTVYGGEVRSFQIQVRPEVLRKFDLTLTDVLTAARMATGVRGAGFIETDNQRIVLETEGQALTAEQLSKAILAQGTVSGIRLGEVATVTEASEPAFRAWLDDRDPVVPCDLP